MTIEENTPAEGRPTRTDDDRILNFLAGMAIAMALPCLVLHAVHAPIPQWLIGVNAATSLTLLLFCLACLPGALRAQRGR